MTMREEFEQQMRAENACTRLERQQEAVGGQYRTISVERAWKRFQAAYAAGQRAEREACEVTCLARVMGDNNREDQEAMACAEAIRNRKEQG